MRRIAQVVAIAALVVAAVVLVDRAWRGEQRAIEDSERDRLRVMATVSASEVAAAAVELSRTVRAMDEGTGWIGPNGFVRPAEPRRIVGLTRDRRADPVGEFYLAEAKRAQDDPNRVIGLLRAASSDERDVGVRKAALLELSAALRRADLHDEAREVDAELLETLTAEERATAREGLLLRSFAPHDSEILADIASAIGGPSEALAWTLLRQLDATDSPEVVARRDELARMTRWRRAVERMGSRDEATSIDDGRIIACARVGDGIAVGETSLPAFPARCGLSTTVTPPANAMVEGREVGPPLPAARVIAFRPRGEVTQLARRRSSWVLGGSVLVLLAGFVAIVQTLRAARRASEIGRAQTRFAAQVGHDLRTPLTLIRMYSETLAAGRVDDPVEAREFASIVARESGRLSTMVERVLDFSKSAARPAPAREQVDLAGLVEDVIAAHQPLFDEHGVECRSRAMSGGLIVLGDPDAIRGAIGNLIDNALRHGEGPIDVEVSRHERRVRISVADRGPGVPPGMEKRVFERFVRAGGVGGGIGLGLAMVRDVARQHGGDAWVEPNVGGGARFVFEVDGDQASDEERT